MQGEVACEVSREEKKKYNFVHISEIKAASDFCLGPKSSVFHWGSELLKYL